MRARLRIEKFVEVYTQEDQDALIMLGLLFWDTKPTDSTKTMEKTKDKNVTYIFKLDCDWQYDQHNQDIETILEELLKRI